MIREHARRPPVSSLHVVTLARVRQEVVALQVTEGPNTDLFWIGQILVAANPLPV
jgi:hypothetical protein